MKEKRYWKICCGEKEVPGLWQRWFKNQCVAVGWKIGPSYVVEGKAKPRSWGIAKEALKQIKPGDMVLVHLKDNRVGRVGEVVRKEIGQWNPLIPPSKKYPFGRYGSHIAVRWDLTVGPTAVDTVVELPKGNQLPPNVARLTICALGSKLYESVVDAMKDERNWVGLQRRFKYEQSLSDFIANFPHRLEDDLLPYPDVKVREKVFPDRSRSDVLLIDREDNPVVVECKQGSPTLDNVQQLRKYMKRFQKETGKKTRGILVHGGTATLRAEVLREAERDCRLKFVRYSLHVDFAPSK
jgi:hypothetical protein